MKISLSPDVEQLIAERVKSGRYQSAIIPQTTLLFERALKQSSAAIANLLLLF